MFSLEERNRAAGLAAEYFGNGYHCAEAVAAAVLETLGEESSAAIKYATAFGGGFGESFKEICGILSGSMIVIGHFHGRQQQGESWSEASQLGRTVLNRFTALHGTCNCGELRSRFGEKEQMTLCRKLVRQGAETLMEALNSKSSDDIDGEENFAGCEKC